MKEIILTGGDWQRTEYYSSRQQEEHEGGGGGQGCKFARHWPLLPPPALDDSCGSVKPNHCHRSEQVRPASNCIPGKNWLHVVTFPTHLLLGIHTSWWAWLAPWWASVSFPITGSVRCVQEYSCTSKFHLPICEEYSCISQPFPIHLLLGFPHGRMVLFPSSCCNRQHSPASYSHGQHFYCTLPHL